MNNYGLYMFTFMHILPSFIILTTKRRQFGKIKLFISKTPKGISEEEKKRRKETTQAGKK